MQVNIIEEAGYNSALYGFSLSYKDRAIKPEDWLCSSTRNVTCPPGFRDKSCDGCPLMKRYKQTKKTATANAGRGMGHDKWLRQVILWVDIEAPRYFWSEFDTYKVGTVTQSESTMHTLSRRDMTVDDLEDIGGCTIHLTESVHTFNKISELNNISIHQIKAFVPESYLQRRIVSLNYAVLRCIVDQRKNHRLPEWKTFIDALYYKCEHPELLPKREVC